MYNESLLTSLLPIVYFLSNGYILTYDIKLIYFILFDSTLQFGKSVPFKDNGPKVKVN